MESLFERARAFAQETAKKSKELIAEGAKISQELAKETVKQTEVLAKQTQVLAQVTVAKTQTLSLDPSKIRDFASETARKAEVGIKALVRELNPSSELSKEEEKELEEYGITPELQDFVRGLTIHTFRDFPFEEAENIKTNKSEESEPPNGGSTVLVTNQSHLLDPWQERHALLLLKAVPEISGFRYVLCPKRMSEGKFWKIYFLLVDARLQPYRLKFAEKEKQKKLDAEKNNVSVAAAAATTTPTSAETQPQQQQQQQPQIQQGSVAEASVEKPAASSTSSAPNSTSPLGISENDAAIASAKEKSQLEKEKNLDTDLDEFLLGGNGSGDENDDDDMDEEDFEKLVNSADPADSDDDKK